ncbi:adenine phosphoribosyltransferase [Gammaproteobacteria bacterium]|nr:adenine phosphoribosyltransferase [Gammaproteobacteria bacterium]
MSDPYNLKDYIRTVNDFPIQGIKFRDITSLIETPDAFVKTCNAMDELTKAFNPSVVVSIESRGFIFAGSISKDLALPFVLARKPGKLPNESYSKEFDLEYGRTSIEIQKNTSITSDDRVVIIDDLVATGGTAIACAELLTENFGVLNDNILVLAVIDLPDLGGSKLIANQGYSVETLVGYSDS